MKRTFFESEPAPTVMISRDGLRTPGHAKCVAWLVLPEDNAFGRDHPNSVWTLRQRGLEPDGSLRVAPPPAEHMGVSTEDVLIPRAVIETLPDDGLFNVRWEFTVGATAQG